MSEKILRRTLIFGTVFFILALLGGSVISLSQVTSTRTAPVSDNVVAGKHVWEKRICQDCHTLLGIGGYWAPELTKETDRRDSAFLTSWMKDPQAVKPGTTMPNQHLSDQQVADVIAFLEWVSKIDTNSWPPQPLGAAAPGGGTPQGALLFQQKGCTACHMINNQGATGPGPNLSHIGSQPYDQLSNTPDFLYKWIEDPKAIKPTTIMPTIPMTEDERLAIVQYLISLK
jgi:nitric oxide reductase subunit C